MIRTTLVLTSVLVAVGAAAPAPAAEQNPAPAGDALVATVKVVTGSVESRAAVGRPWAPVKVGQALAEGADLRTGFRARCIVDMTDSIVQAGPLSLLRILKIRRQGDAVRTRICLKQGSVEADVEKGRIKSDFAIVTPSDVLAVRGTRGINVGFHPVFGGTYGLGTSGLVGLTGGLGQSTPLSPGQATTDPDKPAGEYLADQRMGTTSDAKGFEYAEHKTNRRRNTLFPIPAFSPLGPAPLGALRLLQEQRDGLIYTGPPVPHPSDSCDINEIISPS